MENKYNKKEVEVVEKVYDSNDIKQIEFEIATTPYIKGGKRYIIRTDLLKNDAIHIAKVNLCKKFGHDDENMLTVPDDIKSKVIEYLTANQEKIEIFKLKTQIYLLKNNKYIINSVGDNLDPHIDRSQPKTTLSRFFTDLEQDALNMVTKLEQEIEKIEKSLYEKESGRTTR